MLRPFTVLSPVVKSSASPSRSNQIGAEWSLPYVRTVARTAVLARSSMIAIVKIGSSAGWLILCPALT